MVSRIHASPPRTCRERWHAVRGGGRGGRSGDTTHALPLPRTSSAVCPSGPCPSGSFPRTRLLTDRPTDRPYEILGSVFRHKVILRENLSRRWTDRPCEAILRRFSHDDGPIVLCGVSFETLSRGVMGRSSFVRSVFRTSCHDYGQIVLLESVSGAFCHHSSIVLVV